MLNLPTTNYCINTYARNISVSVPKDVFENFISDISKTHFLSKRLSHYDENNVTHYLTIYDVSDNYGESLGTVAVKHEVM